MQDVLFLYNPKSQKWTIREEYRRFSNNIEKGARRAQDKGKLMEDWENDCKDIIVEGQDKKQIVVTVNYAKYNEEDIYRTQYINEYKTPSGK